MKTLELAKTNIEKGICPRITKHHAQNILFNTETQKWAIISDEQVNELNNLYTEKKNGISAENDIFILHS
jgi:hypothetical protein